MMMAEAMQRESVESSCGVSWNRASKRVCGGRSGAWWSDTVWLDLVSGSWCDLPGGPQPLLRVSSVDLWRRHSLIRVVVDGCAALRDPCAVVIEAAWEDRELLEFAKERSQGRCGIVEVRWRQREGALGWDDVPVRVRGVVAKETVQSLRNVGGFDNR
jgi:hypothetical protein